MPLLGALPLLDLSKQTCIAVITVKNASRGGATSWMECTKISRFIELHMTILNITKYSRQKHGQQFFAENILVVKRLNSDIEHVKYGMGPDGFDVNVKTTGVYYIKF